MKTTEYLDALRSRYNLRSDYALQKILLVRMQTISRYRKGLGAFDDDIAVKVAALLEMDPAQVLADVHAERSKSPQVREIWERIAATFGRAAVIVSAGVLLGGGAGIPAAKASTATVENIYYAQWRRWRSLWQALSAITPNAL